jgi:hypothetical protein
MKKLNRFTSIGIGLIALALLLKQLYLQYNAVFFIQGVSLGLGIFLIVKGFFMSKKQLQ